MKLLDRLVPASALRWNRGSHMTLPWGFLICGSYDHVETSCPTTRLNRNGGCVRCGGPDCEWAWGQGTQHRAVPAATRSQLEREALDRLPHRLAALTNAIEGLSAAIKRLEDRP